MDDVQTDCVSWTEYLIVFLSLSLTHTHTHTDWRSFTHSHVHSVALSPTHFLFSPTGTPLSFLSRCCFCCQSCEDSRKRLAVVFTKKKKKYVKLVIL